MGFNSAARPNRGTRMPAAMGTPSELYTSTKNARRVISGSVRGFRKGGETLVGRCSAVCVWRKPPCRVHWNWQYTLSARVKEYSYWLGQTGLSRKDESEKVHDAV
jgi:hypothetical protein